LSFFTEFAIENGQLEGYAKPVFDGVEIFKQEKEDLLGTGWEAVIGGIAGFFSNPVKERLATRVPLRQNLENMEEG